MHFKKLIGILILFCLITGCQERLSQFVETQIIPVPNSITHSKSHFILNENTGITSNEDFEVSTRFLKTFIEKGSGIKLKFGEEINFIKDSTIHPEAYVLNISDKYIKIKASSDKGAFYAVQTLRQLMPSSLEDGSYKDEKIRIEAVFIEDQPQFSYRGMHLDVGRHMYSVDFIKKYIDALAMLKMNTFHWHLTEDQGWRIEIKKYPKLQDVAAYRDETLIGHYSDQPHQFDGKKYGGYYTQEEIKDIVTYAQERFITIIPEIEMPGHSQAAIAAYPELGCTGAQVNVAEKWGVFEEIYCTKDETFNFLEDVLDEVLELFPSQYIHIGGDEAPKTRWKACSSCQARMKSEGLKDEHELQNYFITRMEKYLNSKGRQIIGWDEILEGGLAPNATVMSWRGTEGAIEAAKSGHKVVMTPTSHCYFDYYQSDNEDEPIAIGGFLPLEKVYSFNPIPKELTDKESKYVLGAQGNIWTEYMPTEKQVEYMTFPRILAMSEVLWSTYKSKDYRDFVKRLENFHERLDVLNVNYANHLYEIEGNMISENGKSFYKLETLTEGKIIRYTLDGNEVNVESEIYSNKIPITESTILKAAVFNSEKQLGKTFSQQINYHKAVGAKITISKEPHKAYFGSGAEGLINGINGSDARYGDKEWLGFWGEDIEVVIDLGNEMIVNCVNTRFYESQGQWIYKPKGLQIELLDKNKESLGGSVEQLLDLAIGSIIKVNEYCDTEEEDEFPIMAKFIVLKVQNYGVIPEGKQGSGNKAWTFIDEIIVN